MVTTIVRHRHQLHSPTSYEITHPTPPHPGMTPLSPHSHRTGVVPPDTPQVHRRYRWGAVYPPAAYERRWKRIRITMRDGRKVLGGMIRIILVGGVRGGVITMDIMIPVSLYVM